MVGHGPDQFHKTNCWVLPKVEQGGIHLLGIDRTLCFCVVRKYIDTFPAQFMCLGPSYCMEFSTAVELFLDFPITFPVFLPVLRRYALHRHKHLQVVHRRLSSLFPTVSPISISVMRAPCRQSSGLWYVQLSICLCITGFAAYWAELLFLCYPI